MNSEQHPLHPFLPANARILMLGSFPPKHERWSMEFFYPNFQNDMWRIMGHLFYGNKNHFVISDTKLFDKERVAAFCRERGIAIYDSAVEVIRLKDNASDDFLQVVKEVDLEQLLRQIPTCSALAVTGQKACDTICRITGCAQPVVGGHVAFTFAKRSMKLYRVPSSSRAYPKSVEWKAAFYEVLFRECGIL